MIHLTNFKELDEEDFFVKFVMAYYKAGWSRLAETGGSTIEVDPALVKFAFDTYSLSLGRYTKVLKSQNPDHYKRAGALIHALYKAEPITLVEWTTEIERSSNFDNVGVSYGDVQHWENYKAWADNYANPGLAFDLGFRCCQLYEPNIKQYDKDFIDSMCFYMSENSAINVDSFVMILKAFMV